MGVNKSGMLPKKTYVYFLFKYILVRQRYMAYRVDIEPISLRTNKLMIGKLLLCLSDNCCSYERLYPGRSKTYMTFDITEESCT